MLQEAEDKVEFGLESAEVTAVFLSVYEVISESVDSSIRIRKGFIVQCNYIRTGTEGLFVRVFG